MESVIDTDELEERYGRLKSLNLLARRGKKKELYLKCVCDCGVVKWATDKEQSNNTSRTSITFPHNGKRYTKDMLREEFKFTDWEIWRYLQQENKTVEETITIVKNPYKVVADIHRKYMYDGKAMDLREVSRTAGVDYEALRYRVCKRKKNKLTVEEAIKDLKEND